MVASHLTGRNPFSLSVPITGPKLDFALGFLASVITLPIEMVLILIFRSKVSANANPYSWHARNILGYIFSVGIMASSAILLYTYATDLASTLTLSLITAFIGCVVETLAGTRLIKVILITMLGSCCCRPDYLVSVEEGGNTAGGRRDLYASDQRRIDTMTVEFTRESVANRSRPRSQSHRSRHSHSGV